MTHAPYSPIQTRWTDPGAYAYLYDDLPRDPEALCAIPRNVLLHDWEARRDQLDLGDRRGDLEIRSIRGLLEKVVASSPDSLRIQRHVDHLRVIDCRHFATLLCSMLRHQGIAARVRFGFAAYIAEPDADPPWVAHAVCEWWDRARNQWRLSDPDLVREVRHDEFLSADAAWLAAREGRADAKLFGFDPGMRGLGVIAAELVRDAASRSGFEAVYGDSWGIADELYNRPISDEETALFDALAATPDNAIASVMASDVRLALPLQINHFAYARGETYRVDLANDQL